jgi:transglutaminase-like putative cysteine protease
MRRIKIEHRTKYEYQTAVQFLQHRLLIRPREGHDMRIESSRLDIEPNYSIRWHREVYGNSVATVDFLEAAERLSILSQVVVQHYEEAPPDLVVAEEARQFPFHYDPIGAFAVLG